MRPVTIAPTPKAFATSCGSTSLPLYLKVELRAMTLSWESCDRLLIKPSLIPSERYSMFESFDTLTNGKTATEFICAECRALHTETSDKNAMITERLINVAAITGVRFRLMNFAPRYERI